MFCLESSLWRSLPPSEAARGEVFLIKLAPFRIYGGTFPRLNQTGEGFLHKFGSPVGPKQGDPQRWCCEAVSEFESVWVHACVSGVITRRQFCILLYRCSSCCKRFARKAHSESPTCISRYICSFANALLGKLSRIDLHALAFPRNVHRNR